MLADKTKIRTITISDGDTNMTKTYFCLSNQENIDNIKRNVIDLIERELEPDEIAYYSKCISKILACRSIDALNLQREEKDRIDSRHVEFEVKEMSEEQIKQFILAKNSSLFSSFEYDELHSRIFSKEEEIKLAI